MVPQKLGVIRELEGPRELGELLDDYEPLEALDTLVVVLVGYFLRCQQGGQ